MRVIQDVPEPRYDLSICLRLLRNYMLDARKANASNVSLLAVAASLVERRPLESCHCHAREFLSKVRSHLNARHHRRTRTPPLSHQELSQSSVSAKITLSVRASNIGHTQ